MINNNEIEKHRVISVNSKHLLQVYEIDPTGFEEIFPDLIQNANNTVYYYYDKNRNTFLGLYAINRSDMLSQCYTLFGDTIKIISCHSDMKGVRHKIKLEKKLPK